MISMVVSKAITMADCRRHLRRRNRKVVSKAITMVLVDGIFEGEIEGCFE